MKRVVCLVLSVVVVVAAMITDTVSQKQDDKVETWEPDDDQDDELTLTDEATPDEFPDDIKVFTPTEEWQTIEPGSVTLTSVMRRCLHHSLYYILVSCNSCNVKY